MEAQLLHWLKYFEAQNRPGLSDSIAITWVRYETYPRTGNGRGASWRHRCLFYPSSIAGFVYAIAIEEWLKRDWLPDSHELRRALHDMLVESNNDAAGFIVDLLTGTTSGPSLYGAVWQNWKEQRQVVNQWLRSLKWKELEQVNCCQKIWGNGPYGREYDFANLAGWCNTLTTEATAVMLEAVMSNAIVSPVACSRLRSLLLRPLNLNSNCCRNSRNQIAGFLGAGIPSSSRLWSKTGWTNQVRHEAACWQPSDNGPTTLLVVFSAGEERSNDDLLLPGLATVLQFLETT
ncbi:beta-lactamase superfamily protein [cyanobiont of Ornithocercus magnificus]|nr:beta-lactamase superfamily protein [cyanobiont of Ornithocercus magnificus]